MAALVHEMHWGKKNAAGGDSNAACGDDQRRTRGLRFPHAAFFLPFWVMVRMAQRIYPVGKAWLIKNDALLKPSAAAEATASTSRTASAATATSAASFAATALASAATHHAATSEASEAPVG